MDALKTFNYVMACFLVAGGLIGIGVFLARCVDWRREAKMKEAMRELDRKKNAKVYERARNAGGWVILFLLFFAGCNPNAKTFTGKLLSREASGTRIENEYTLRFAEGTEWRVIDQGGHPWPLGQTVIVSYEDRTYGAYITDVAVTTEPKSLATKTIPEQILKTPTGKPITEKKVLFSGQTRFGELVIYENEYNRYLDDVQVQADNDSVLITRKAKK